MSTAPTVRPWPGNPDLATLYPPAAVERVVDITRDRWTVTLAIEPRTVLAALAEALAGKAADLVTLRWLSTDDAQRHAAMTRLASDPKIVRALTLTLTPEQADSLGDDLLIAGNDLPCQRCHAQRENPALDTCTACTPDDEPDRWAD